jgi:hypothetical protein
MSQSQFCCHICGSKIKDGQSIQLLSTKPFGRVLQHESCIGKEFSCCVCGDPTGTSILGVNGRTTYPVCIDCRSVVQMLDDDMGSSDKRNVIKEAKKQILS